jgi:hypothetical protein
MFTSQRFQVTGCFVVLQLWIHPILLHLLPVPIAYSLIKRGIFNLGSSDQFSAIASQVRGSISKWIEIRSDVIVPRPAKFIWKEMGRLKRALLQGKTRKHLHLLLQWGSNQGVIHN